MPILAQREPDPLAALIFAYAPTVQTKYQYSTQENTKTPKHPLYFLTSAFFYLIKLRQSVVE